MRELDFFNYTLPKEKIAQQPVSKFANGQAGDRVHKSGEYSFSKHSDRAQSKLLYFKKNPQHVIEDRRFADLPSLLDPRDVLVLNNSRVIPCRFFAKKKGSVGEIEILLLNKIEDASPGEVWQAFARPMRNAKKEDELQLSPGLVGKVLGRSSDSKRLVLHLRPAEGSRSVFDLILAEGSMPIPHYIREGRADENDKERYQTVFSDTLGSVAAPTAGLHFTEDLMRQITAQGTMICFITLHVGPASFIPVCDVVTHQMPEERFVVASECKKTIESAKSVGGKVVAVGTTAARALESAFSMNTYDKMSETTLFIKPGYEFNVVDKLITNFHQPGTSHLLLVAALIGEAETAGIYQHALAADYRFLSYGDAMFLDPTH